jgi:hypothetical protein
MDLPAIRLGPGAIRERTAGPNAPRDLSNALVLLSRHLALSREILADLRPLGITQMVYVCYH